MIRRLLLLALGLLVAAPAAIARQTPVTVRAGRLLDGVGDVREGVTITVQGARKRRQRRAPSSPPPGPVGPDGSLAVSNPGA